jgi:hypothetical protein
VPWEVEYTDEFESWWHTLSETEQGKLDARVQLLMETGTKSRLSIQFASEIVPLSGDANCELRQRATL